MAFAWKSHTVIWRKLGEFLVGILVIRAIARFSIWPSIQIAVWGGQAITPVATNP
jgi:hypothetical protein